MITEHDVIWCIKFLVSNDRKLYQKVEASSSIEEAVRAVSTVIETEDGNTLGLLPDDFVVKLVRSVLYRQYTNPMWNTEPADRLRYTLTNTVFDTAGNAHYIDFPVKGTKKDDPEQG